MRPPSYKAIADEYTAAIRSGALPAGTRLPTHRTPALLRQHPPGGHRHDRAVVATYLLDRGVDTTPENVLLTSGAQQALDCVLRTLTRPGGVLAVDALSYPGIKASSCSPPPTAPTWPPSRSPPPSASPSPHPRSPDSPRPSTGYGPPSSPSPLEPPHRKSARPTSCAARG
ncbi:hypothetical protein ACWC9T_20805 [Kitasatospora sp. NPDC001159]